MTTIVSAYIDLKRSTNGIKSLEDYLSYSIPLLQLEFPKIVFLEPHVINLLKHVHPSTKIIPFSKEDLIFRIDNCNLPININPNKDTPEYFSVQLNKTDWINMASKIREKSTHFAWVDFGISHVCYNPNFNKLNKEYDRIRIAGCWDPKKYVNGSLDSPNWFFCGGIFSGPIDKLKIFNYLVKEYTNKYLESGKITWEINIWKLIYDDYPDLFDWYYSDHDCGMINNY